MAKMAGEKIEVTTKIGKDMMKVEKNTQQRYDEGGEEHTTKI
jgi:hypothetical protein